MSADKMHVHRCTCVYRNTAGRGTSRGGRFPGASRFAGRPPTIFHRSSFLDKETKERISNISRDSFVSFLNEAWTSLFLSKEVSFLSSRFILLVGIVGIVDIPMRIYYCNAREKQYWRVYIIRSDYSRKSSCLDSSRVISKTTTIISPTVRSINRSTYTVYTTTFYPLFERFLNLFVRDNDASYRGD